jgi:hypothetical protein
MTAFCDYPAGHWIYLRTTSPIEPAFATVRLRTRVTKEPGSRAAGIATAVKLIESAPGPLARSAHPTGSPWSALARGPGTASSPDDPSNQEVISKPRDQGAMRAAGIPVSGNFRVRSGCLTGVGGMDGLRHAGWAGR